jgi:hypothetical protein
MRRYGLLIIMALLILSIPAAVHAQGDDTDMDTLVAAAIEFLGQQLATPLTGDDIARWSWEETYWPDVSLGCPVADQDYAQVLTNGFIITLEHAGSAYEIHLTSDGSALAYCGSMPLVTTTPLPDTGTPSPAAGDPEIILQTAIAYLNAQLDTAITREALSRWMWEDATWPDAGLGCPQPDTTYDAAEAVDGYTVTLEYVNRSFELHMTTDGSTIMPCDAPDLRPLVDGSLIGAIATPDPAATPSSLPTPVLPTDTTLIYTDPTGITRLTRLDNFPGMPITGTTTDIAPTPAPLPQYDHTYSAYRWSPDGQYAAFIDTVSPARLLLTDAAGNPPIILAEGVSPDYPPVWSPDGTTLAYLMPTSTFRGSNQVMQVYGLTVTTPFTLTGDPALLVTIEIATGCGGGTPDPAAQLYQRETGFMGSSKTLRWTANNQLLYTPSCLGVGLSAVNLLTGTITPLVDDLARLSFNADGTQAAGVIMSLDGRTPQGVAIQQLSGGRDAITLDIVPDQLYWDEAHNRLYISETVLSQTLTRQSTSDTVEVYTVRLWEYDLATGELLQRFEQEGRGIGQIAAAPGSDGLIFSFVESARDWLITVENGAGPAAQREAAPGIWLLYLTGDNRIVRIGPGSQPSFQPILPEAQG